MILGLETSCDETAAAVVTRKGEILANVVASQADLHARFGGVVPEIASRRHLELVVPVVSSALEEAGAALPDAALAPLPLCTDNAAMIASAARFTPAVPYPDYLSLDAQASA